ncbi:virion host shut-off [Psittacid alphaherpesvirus 1]|uniref:Virion host shutoff protein n=1 Tax=Psittacid herpesvirus 1 (isolate Amazon parrot/-/97-0001/1997) TaxID=670426 RepID=SHUT_PSHV1|nr:tegument host shutoff protein [Psittacid alphaherpesvirus 1]Q6UDJ0.1 RecName: Full=Virion host shutoff protein; Short=Vhs [Psittacid herpesvirus 1 Amazon parrot/1997]AAQ73720.1 virion host shut-off [Psittacid alphaherpesvirus 1]
MGILGMRRFIREHELSVHLSIQMERGLYIPIAVDTWNVLTPIMRRLDPGNMMDPVERTLRGIMQVFSLLNKKSCFPIFVLDGGRKRAFKGPVKHDYHNIDHRAPTDGDDLEASANENQPHSLAGNAPRLASGARGAHQSSRRKTALRATPHYKLCWDLITASGFPTVYVKGMEADYGCANLFHTKTVMYVWSSDSDMVFMGCDVITDLTPAFPVAVFSKHVLEYLNMTQREFANTFVDCHTNLHSPETIYSFAAKLLEHRCGSAIDEPPAASEESSASDQQSADEDEHGAWSRYTRRPPRRADAAAWGAGPGGNGQLKGVSVLCGFPSDARPFDCAPARRRRLPQRREEPAARLKKNREFLAYMNSFIGCKVINNRHTLIKRVPIRQETFDPVEIYRILHEYAPTMANKWCAEMLVKCKLKPVPPLRDVAYGKATQINLC